MEALQDLTSLDELIAALAERNLTPGWVRREKPFLWPEMRSAFVPAHWRYAEAKAAMQAAGRLIGTDLAERRNFVMRNPIPENDGATLRTLICAYQSILPGERARTHRHSPHALRVVLEAHGSYSVVDGDKHPMESGDIVLTPGGCWHGHGHDGEEQAYWFDGLDVPLTHLLEPMFFEEHPAGFAPVSKVSEESPFRFSWTSIEPAVHVAPSDRFFGRTIELPTPTMPTIHVKLHAWHAGWRNAPYRQSANTIHVIMKGRGRSRIDGCTFEWSFGDTLAVPSWTRIEHEAQEDSVIFSMTDEKLMRWAHYYRFQDLEA